jgi:hypothetical protein
MPHTLTFIPQPEKDPLMRFSPSTADLVAYISSLVAGVLLILLGVSPESIAAIALGLSTLYAAWQGHRPPKSSQDAPPPSTRSDGAPSIGSNIDAAATQAPDLAAYEGVGVTPADPANSDAADENSAPAVVENWTVDQANRSR